jgi:hypothetical protein
VEKSMCTLLLLLFAEFPFEKSFQFSLLKAKDKYKTYMNFNFLNILKTLKNLETWML